MIYQQLSDDLRHFYDSTDFADIAARGVIAGATDIVIPMKYTLTLL